jgi:hypothetical protein
MPEVGNLFHPSLPARQSTSHVVRRTESGGVTGAMWAKGMQTRQPTRRGNAPHVQKRDEDGLAGVIAPAPMSAQVSESSDRPLRPVGCGKGGRRHLLAGGGPGRSVRGPAHTRSLSATTSAACSRLGPWSDRPTPSRWRVREGLRQGSCPTGCRPTDALARPTIPRARGPHLRHSAVSLDATKWLPSNW